MSSNRKKLNRNNRKSKKKNIDKNVTIEDLQKQLLSRLQKDFTFWKKSNSKDIQEELEILYE